MQLANIKLRLNKFGSTVPILNATPAEAILLHVLHQGNNGGSTFGDKMEDIKVVGDTKLEVEPAVPAVPAAEGKPAIPAKPAVVKDRTNVEELRRLTTKYGRCVTKKGDKIIKLLWPGTDVKLPQTFAEIKWNEIQFDGEEIAPLNLATGAPAPK